MGAIAPINITDGTNTHVFQPVRHEPDFQVYDVPLEPGGSATIELIAREKLSFWVRRPKGAANGDSNSNYRVGFTLELPVLEEAAAGAGNSAGYVPPAAVNHRLLFKGEMVIPSQASLDSVDLIHHLGSGIAAQAVFETIAKDRNLPY